MNKVIHLEQHIKKQESERRSRIFDAENARVQLVYQKKYKIDIETTDLFRKFIGEKKTYFEFLEALPKLEPRILYYVLVTYYFCWHRCYRKLMDTIHIFPALKIYYKKYYSAKNYKKIFYYICYPRIVKSGVKSEQSELFLRKVNLRLVR
jgi:hypothetical protein